MVRFLFTNRGAERMHYGGEMNPRYDRDEFLDLMTMVEDQGGTHLDEVCPSQTVAKWTGPHAKPMTFESCGESALFEVNYEDENGQPYPITLCAVDDAMGAMPRFGGDAMAAKLDRIDGGE